MDTTHSRNRFLALAELASHENWCWKLGCTTCGHGAFRYALKDLANGIDPDSPEWRVHGNRRLHDLGPLPRELSAEEQQSLLDFVSRIGLDELRAVVRWPDWLGYENFKPLIEGEIEPNRQPIFVKALTYGTRVIRLSEGFTKREDHLREARRLVVSHFEDYADSSLVGAFPIRHYQYFIKSTRAVRISVSGEVMGIFEGVAANASFVFVGGDGAKKRFEIVENR